MEEYLQPVDDKLVTRESNDYVRQKLDIVSVYLGMVTQSMKYKQWAGLNYIDLQAGPGKNKIKDTSTILLGSPLLALTQEPPFTHYFFNEINPRNLEALKRRIGSSPYSDRVTIYGDDLKIVVDDVCAKLHTYDANAKRQGQWSYLNAAFLDPEGLELEWSTVEKLARLNRMDLIINFSTSGIRRNTGAKNYEIIDRFFGTSNWQSISGNPTDTRRAYIKLYRDRLKAFDYHIVEDLELGYSDIAFKNQKNAEVYSLVFASKHPLGEKFWREARKIATSPKLPGF